MPGKHENYVGAVLIVAGQHQSEVLVNVERAGGESKRSVER